MVEGQEHTLEFLLSFDGHVNWYAEGYSTKFEIKRVEPSPSRPHGLRYSFTLHNPSGKRLMGFDNAHPVAPAGSRFTKRQPEADHWHRTESDEGRPYLFTDAATLVFDFFFDFFAKVERALTERGIPLDVTNTGQTGKRRI